MKYNYARRPSRKVSVGGVIIGGDSPVRLQSMTNTPSLDVNATAAQALRIAEAGGEIVRITTQGVKEAESLGQVRRLLESQGKKIPLVADVHFNPKAAMTAATTAHKVRINPGNFADAPRAVESGSLSEEEYSARLRHVAMRLEPLLEECRRHGTALRLGVNHGSLSSRIMMRYGDTPKGMTESVMEYLRICREKNFHDIVISVKASNPAIMISTVRLLVASMNAEGMDYPLHLGVTEAGNGEDGRIKSAVGIGTLLAEGLGDTIRVSLSEAPEREIPVAALLRDHISQRHGHDRIIEPAHASERPEREGARMLDGQPRAGVPIVAGVDFDAQDMNIHIIDASSNPDVIVDEKPIALSSTHVNPVGEIASYIDRLRETGRKNPVILHFSYTIATKDELAVVAGADIGALMMNGYGSAIWLEAPGIAQSDINSISLGILQACRLRMTKTEYIACPGCGRTLFDLESTLERIKASTIGLKGLKIAVMGCIVNGPGEMADADYGYVGAGADRVSLYRGKEAVARNIPANEAVERLLNLLRQDGILQ